MKMSEFDGLIGHRELFLADNGKVIVSIGVSALLAEDESDYYCSYRISGLTENESGRVIGSDALQALQLALIRVGSILYTSKEWNENILTWNGERNLGFPLPNSLKDLYPTQDGVTQTE
jgi:hypothetical protein